jgi:hypothetical protein
MSEEQNISNAKLLNELATAQFMKIQAVKIAAFEQVLLKNNAAIYREYETKFNSLRDADEGLKELANVIKQLQQSMEL